MGYNARNDEIRDNVTRMRREWEAHAYRCFGDVFVVERMFPQGSFNFF
jgi:hypothetical protein